MPESRWLEEELLGALGPVEAPRALWDRIHDQPARRQNRWAVWPVAAVLALMVTGAAVWQAMRGHSPAAGLDALAARELLSAESGPPKLDFDSSDPAAIRAWVKTKTGLNLELPARNPAVRLLGARVIQSGGSPVAAIAYRVGSERAALLVSRTGAAGGRRHIFAQAGLASWTMRGQAYSIACSGQDPQEGCLLCHTGS